MKLKFNRNPDSVNVLAGTLDGISAFVTTAWWDGKTKTTTIGYKAEDLLDAAICAEQWRNGDFSTERNVTIVVKLKK